MKNFYTTNNKKITIDDCDFERVTRHRWYYYHDANTNGIFSTIDGKLTSLRRFILDNPDYYVYNKNGDIFDNRRSNIGKFERGSHTRKLKFTKNKYKGVCKYRDRFRCWVIINKKFVNLGIFENEKNAALIRDAAIRLFFNESDVYLNFEDEKIILDKKILDKINERIA